MSHHPEAADGELSAAPYIRSRWQRRNAVQLYVGICFLAGGVTGQVLRYGTILVGWPHWSWFLSFPFVSAGVSVLIFRTWFGRWPWVRTLRR